MSHRHSIGPKEGQISGGVVEDCLWCSDGGGDPQWQELQARAEKAEAELVHAKEWIAQGKNHWKARAEKAEAELARLSNAGLTIPEARKEWREMKARAEKAEAALAELETELVEARRHEHEVIEAYDRQYARAEKAEARVAELEMEVDFWKTGVETNPIWKRNPAMHSQVYAMLEAIKEAREREAE